MVKLVPRARMPKKSKTNTIHINGRRYNASTGEPLDGTHQATAVKLPAKPAGRRQPNHTRSHAPVASRTLVRRAVSKSAGHPKHRIKAQGRADAPHRTVTVAPIKASVASLDASRIRHARQIKRSRLISHFSGAAIYPKPTPNSLKTPAMPERPVHHAKPKPHKRKSVLHRRAKPTSTAELLDQALRHATSYRELPVK